jgi:ribosomal-protein-alanine N-acetyltransferase
MKPVALFAPILSDLHALYEFEVKNRAFFESHINARPADYYSLEGVARAIDTAVADAAADRGYQYLIEDGDGRIVGRVNLSNVKRQLFHSAVLGYRVAEDAGGKGYASEAVRKVLDIAFSDLGLLRIESDARVDNLGSVRVLLRNGFSQYGHSKRSFELGGAWHDRLHFERHAQ